MNQLMSNKGDCRTAPATPGLLKRVLTNKTKIGLNESMVVSQLSMSINRS